MQVTNFEEVEDQIKFGREAAAAFAKDPKMYSFSRVDLAAAHSRGDYIALRWGLHERAVLILKLDRTLSRSYLVMLFRERMQSNVP